MKLKAKTVKIDGEKFVVQELRVKQLLPLLKAMTEDSAEGSKLIFDAAVTMEGIPLNVDEMPASVYMKLLPEVMEVNNLGGDDDEGNA